eukprot:s1355_g2.t1
MQLATEKHPQAVFIQGAAAFKEAANAQEALIQMARTRLSFNDPETLSPSSWTVTGLVTLKQQHPQSKYPNDCYKKIRLIAGHAFVEPPAVTGKAGERSPWRC